jgi:hypothetical protein
MSLSMRVDRITALGATIIAIAGIGIGTAAGTSTARKGVKACVTIHGVLQVASSSGRCPTHTSKITIAKQGPRGETGKQGKPGPQGPGAKNITLDAASSQQTKTLTFAAGDKIELDCDGTPQAGVETLTFTPPGDASTATKLYGTIEIPDTGANGGRVTVDANSNPINSGDGHSAFEYNAGGPWTITFTSLGTVTETQVHVFVLSGTSTYTLDLLGSIPGSAHCIGAVQVTPSS